MRLPYNIRNRILSCITEILHFHGKCQPEFKTYGEVVKIVCCAYLPNDLGDTLLLTPCRCSTQLSNTPYVIFPVQIILGSILTLDLHL